MLVAAAWVPAHAQPSAPASGSTVHWYENDFPPLAIVGGPDAGQGVVDQIMALLQKRTPQFHHSIEPAALSRVIDLIKNGPDVCSASLLRTPQREAAMDFSLPLIHLMPNGLVVLQKHAASFEPFLNERSELRLGDLLASGKLRVGLSPGRSFGPAVDPLLRQYAASVVTIPSTDVFGSRLLKLANQDEFDAIIGYAIELTYTVRMSKLNQRDFVIYPIAESSALLPMYVGCSRSEQGRRILAALNHEIASPEVRHQFELYYRAWLDVDSVAYYDRQLQAMRNASK